MPDNTEKWPSVTPTPFTNTDECYWRDGKPCCTRHHRCVVRTSAVPALRQGLGGTHVCPDCMRETADAR